jgi:hypothetical protein
MLVYLIVLFVILIPGQFITLPSQESSKMTINIFHAIIFAAIFHFTQNGL